MTTQLDVAVNEGMEAFWSAIAAAYPFIETGDFPPEAAMRLEQAMRDAADLWVDING